MPISARENYLRTVRRTNPEWMPYTINLTIPLWRRLGAELEDIVLRHPRTWPNYKPGSMNWRDPIVPPYTIPGVDFIDEWGSVWRTNELGQTQAVIKPALEDLSILDAYTSPDPATYLGGWAKADWELSARNMARAKAAGALTRLGLDHGYHFLRLEYLRGFENLMCDMIEDTPQFRRIVEMVHERNMAAVRNAIRAGAEVIALPEDLGSQKGAICGPRMARKWILPYQKQLHDLARNAGCLTVYHCDGAIMDIADQILEIHPDVFNPQDIANGVENLREAFKDRLCIDLDFDRQGALPLGTPREIRDLVEYETRTLGSPTGGMMLHAGVWGDVPPQNVEALVGAFEEFSLFWFQ
ncbi:MAG: methylcobalamin:coenzyme M methyltransferase [candidate division BRC1 bacterium ADurb.BinA364]|nr:MAG: methylcobalamin:coenzyme M methyltransferase [candidate division BRC1 bacterium ADurb.BinA364]